MKKCLLVFTLLFNNISYAAEFTNTDKREILQQFIEFQQAIKQQDVEKLNTMIDQQTYAPSRLLSPTADSDEKSTDYIKYQKNLLTNLDNLTLVNADPKTTAFIPVIIGAEIGTAIGTDKCSFSVTGDFVDPSMNDKQEMGFDIKENGIQIFYSAFAADDVALAPGENIEDIIDSCVQTDIYYFSLTNHKLLLRNKQTLP